MNTRVIDHQQAIKDMLAERYLLGELADPDRDAYEAHLFECNTCFAQVKAGTDLVNYVTQHGAEASAMAGLQTAGFLDRLMAGLRQPVAAFAVPLLVLAVGVNLYQQRELSRQKEASLEWSYVLTGIAHGGESAKLIRVPHGSRLSLNVEYTPRGEFTAYGVRILSDSGLAKSKLPIARDQA